jgi:hypothetical protein
MEKIAMRKKRISIFLDLSGDKIVRPIVKKNRVEIHVNPKKVKKYMIKYVVRNELEHLARLHFEKMLETADKKRKWDKIYEIIRSQEKNGLLIE